MILNMSDLIQGVMFGVFSIDLLPYANSINDEKELEEKDVGEQKKHKPNLKEDGKRHIINENHHPELKMKEMEIGIMSL